MLLHDGTDIGATEFLLVTQEARGSVRAETGETDRFLARTSTLTVCLAIDRLLAYRRVLIPGSFPSFMLSLLVVDGALLLLLLPDRRQMRRSSSTRRAGTPAISRRVPTAPAAILYIGYKGNSRHGTCQLLQETLSFVSFLCHLSHATSIDQTGD